MTRNQSIHAISAALAVLIVSAATPARADRCDDLASQLKNQIDGLGVGKTAANLIYLSHPKAKEITLGCAGRNFQMAETSCPLRARRRMKSSSSFRYFGGSWFATPPKNA